jgi:hypothetical protein
MTAPGNLICSKCGFSNVPGDQFCGSCGAFLEWEGVPTADPGAAAPAGSGPLADVPVVGPPPGAGTTERPFTPGPVAVPATPPPATSAAPAADPGLIRCPACGIANTAGRTFCQSCGTKLPEAAAVQSASAAQIAAAVNAPSRPATGTPASTRTVTAEPEEGSGGGGLLKWLVLVAIVGVLAGVGIVAGSTLLRGSASSDASSNPSLAVRPSSSGGAAGSPAGSAGTGGSPGTSSAPAVSVPLTLTNATASSVVGDLAKFQPAKAIDGDPKTCWQEGNATEKGEWIEVSFAPARVTSLLLTNGYNASKALYRGNHRLKDIQISINGGAPIAAKLKDVGTPQRIEVPPIDGATTVRITIASIYPSVKTSVAGTPFDDAALGEIVVMGVTAP